VNLGAALLLGLIQGITEFLPVSSSGHLALVQMLIPGFHQPGVLFDAMLHVGTASAVVWFERRQILEWLRSQTGRRMAVLLVVGTAATAVVGLLLKDVAAAAFVKPLWVGVFLLITGLVVASTRFLAGGDGDENTMTWRQAAVIGLLQGTAVFPGLSRSGATIAAGLGVGLQRPWAARFSFLLGVPAIAGVTAVELVSQRHALAGHSISFFAACAIGMAAAAVSGYCALRIVLATVSSRVFHRFAWYCVPLGLVVIAIVAGMD
jgi:undecaprenyl-diphosphatase